MCYDQETANTVTTNGCTSVQSLNLYNHILNMGPQHRKLD